MHMVAQFFFGSAGLSNTTDDDSLTSMTCMMGLKRFEGPSAAVRHYLGIYPKNLNSGEIISKRKL